MIETTVQTFKNLINGEWVDSASRKTFQSVNPADIKDIVGIFQASTEEDATNAVRAAEYAFASWAGTPPSKRAEILNKAADLFESRIDQIARELTREEGKILSASRMEVGRSASTFRFYAVEATTFTGETFPVDDGNSFVYTIREPLGVISVITPWNFPVSIAARKIAPALMAGNTVVFKPSSDTPLVGLRLVEALVDAGIPKGVINFVTGSAARVSQPLLTDPAIRAVTFTGSTGAGESIQKSVGLTTRTQMELGGKNPLIVLEDADIDKAVQLTIKAGFELTGQACTGTSRVIIMRSVHDAYVSRLIERTKELAIGNGLLSGIELGPLANQKQLKNVLYYIEKGMAEGATLEYGGTRLMGGSFDTGYYVTPAIFTNVTPEMTIAKEEIFGPVVGVIAVDTFDEALRIANDSEYGLSASIVTTSIEKAHKFAKAIQSGTVKINRTTTGNLMNAPFGGLKKSSTSTFRESGRVGLEFFTQTKTVYYGY
jgi:alpha-ketoglutaric semialdehyde dehydrogenase